MLTFYSMLFSSAACHPTSAQPWRTRRSSPRQSSPSPLPRCSTRWPPKLLWQLPHPFLPRRRRLSLQSHLSVTAALLAAQQLLGGDRQHLIATAPKAATVAVLRRGQAAAASAGTISSSATKLAVVRPSIVTGKTNSGSGGNTNRLSIIADRNRRRFLFSSPSSPPHLPRSPAHQHPLPGRHWCSTQPHPLHFIISSFRTHNS
jgi:hypothetical protein